jgi:hypothetical protein
MLFGREKLSLVRSGVVSCSRSGLGIISPVATCWFSPVDRMSPKKKPAKKAQRKRRASRARCVDSAPVAEVVGSVAGGPLSADALPGDQIRLVLEMVVLRRGLDTVASAASAAEWVAAVHSNLLDIGVSTVRELLVALPDLNEILSQSGHQRLHAATIVQLMEELSHLITWPGEEPDEEDWVSGDSDG